MHSFCLECLQRVPLIHKEGNKHYIDCPVGKRNFPVPDGGVASFRPSHVIVNLIEVYQKLRMERNPDDKPSVKQHPTLESTAVPPTDHDLHKDTKPPSQGSELNCSNCKTGKADLFCDNCQELVCSDCIGLDKHFNHAHVPSRDAYSQHEANLVDSTIHPLNHEIARFIDARQGVLDVKKGVLQQAESTRSDIYNLVSELRKNLDEAEKKLVADLDEGLEIQLGVLNKQLSNLDASLDQMDECKKQIEKFIDQAHVDGSPLEIIAKKSELKFYTQCVISKVQNATFEPFVKPSIQLVMKDKIKDAFSTLGHIVMLDQVSEIKLDVSYEHIPVANQLSSVAISFVLPDGQLFPVPPIDINCYLTLIPEDTEPLPLDIPCSVMTSPDADGLYRVNFTPLARGPHQLSVQVKGDERIQDCVLPVSASPEMRMKSIGSIKVPCPTGVVVDGEGRLIISNCSKHRLDVFTKSGSQCTSICPHEGDLLKMHYPQGLALSSKGTILVSDGMNNCVQEFTLNGNRESVSGFINCPLGIAISKKTQNVFVVESKKNAVQVLKPDLSFSYSFGIDSATKLGKLSKPHDVIIDSDGFVYVTDYGNHRVVKFTAEGQAISVFGGKECQLHRPSGITIERNFLYINQDGSNLVIINTDGQYVTSLKKNCIWFASNSWLNGITIDVNTGVLYVSKYADGKIDLR